MKRILTLSTLLFVLVSALWFNTGTARASASVMIFYIPGINSDELGSATMVVGSETYEADCALKDAETGKVVCHIPGKYAGQEVVFYIAGQMFFAAEIPAPQEERTCTPPTVFGADVFYHLGYGDFTFFTPGDNFGAVGANASYYLSIPVGSDYYEILSDIYCGIVVVDD